MTHTQQEKITAHLVLRTALLLILPAHVLTRPTTVRCKWAEHTYGVGETWQPASGQLCANCTCLEGGTVDCQGPKCPPIDCKEPRHLEGQCCPTCDDPPSVPTAAPEKTDETNTSPSPGCDFNGEHYEVGDAFPSNKSAMTTNSDNQCVLCHCMEGGRLECVLQTCLLRTGCRKVVRVSYDCCPVCADDDVLGEDSMFFSNTSLEGGDCATPSGQRVSNGSSWRPTIGEIGEVECVTCHCKDGRITCRRLVCPEDASLPCSDPRHQQGQCCKSCPGERKRKKERKGRAGKVKRRKKRKCKNLKGEAKKKCRRRAKKLKKKRRKSKKSGGRRRAKFSPERRLHEVIGQLCLPSNADYLVYRTKGENFDSLSFDNLRENRVEHFSSVIQREKIQKSERKLIQQPEEVRKKARVGDILGTVQKKDVKRFKRRLDRKQKCCKKKCRRKMLDRSIEKLTIRPIDLTKSCARRTAN